MDEQRSSTPCVVGSNPTGDAIHLKLKVTMKTLGITDVKGAKANISDIVVFGDGDQAKLLFKASSEKQGWMKSTKAIEIPGVGCIVQVTTQQRNQAKTTIIGSILKLIMGKRFKPEVTYSLAEATSFVPGVMIVGDAVKGRRLVSIEHPQHSKHAPAKPSAKTKAVAKAK